MQYPAQLSSYHDDIMIFKNRMFLQIIFSLILQISTLNYSKEMVIKDYMKGIVAKYKFSNVSSEMIVYTNKLENRFIYCAEKGKRKISVSGIIAENAGVYTVHHESIIFTETEDSTY